MYFPVSFSRNFSAARRRAISFWRSVSWGASGSGSGSVVAMGTTSVTGAAASAGASPGSDRSCTRRQRAHDGGTTSAAAWATSSASAILRLHICDGSMAWRLTEASRRDSVEGRATDQSMYTRLVLLP